MLTRRQTLQCLGAAGLAAATNWTFAKPLDDEGIKVLSFNVLNGGTSRGPLEQTVKLIRDSGADVVGMQEVRKNGEALAKLTGLHWVSQGAEDEGILSRFPVAQTSAKAEKRCQERMPCS